MCTPQSKVTHACLLDLDSTASRSHLCCVKIQQPSKLWLNLSDLCKSKIRLMKPTPQMCSTTSRDQNLGTRPLTATPRATTCCQRLQHVPTRHRYSYVPTRFMVTRATLSTSQPADLQNPKIWPPISPTHSYTYRLGFWVLLHAPVTFHALVTCWNTCWPYHSASSASQLTTSAMSPC